MAIIGSHMLLYSSDPEALRTTLRDAFGFKSVDAGGGWLIFALPPAELGIHPADGTNDKTGARHQLSFMCDDIQKTVAQLRAKGIQIHGKLEQERWGIHVMMTLPGGVEVMLYEPLHAMAIQPAQAG